jgi:hypothetical protein
MRTLWRRLLAVLLLIPVPAVAAPVCEPGSGYIAADTAQQVHEEFLVKLKAAGIGTVIRYYDWVEETLPGKTLTRRELDLIARIDMSVAVIFQHRNDCLCTFMTRGRGSRDARRALELAKAFSQPAGSAIYFGVDGVDAQFLSLLSATDLPSGEAQARKFVHTFVHGYFQEAAKGCSPPATKSALMDWSVPICSMKDLSTIAGLPMRRAGPPTSASRPASAGFLNNT